MYTVKTIGIMFAVVNEDGKVVTVISPSGGRLTLLDHSQELMEKQADTLNGFFNTTEGGKDVSV